QPRGDLGVFGVAKNAPGDDDGDLVRVERAPGGKENVVLLVALADHHRHAGAAVHLLLHLHLDQRALLFHDEDRLEAFGETEEAIRLERPWRGNLVEPDAEVGGALLVDAEEIERAQGVEPALAERDDSETWLPAAIHHDL